MRLSIGAYDISAYLDNLGYEAMQDWTPLCSLAQKRTVWDDQGKTNRIYTYDSREERALPKEIRYKVAARKETGVQREQQAMTAGAQKASDSQVVNEDDVISCGVICQSPLWAMAEHIKLTEDTQDISDLKSLPCLKNVDKIGVASIDRIGKFPGVLNFEKALPEARSLVVLLTRIPKRVVELAGKQKAEDVTSYSYLQYQLIRELLWSAHDLGDELISRGHDSLVLADCSLNSFRTVAPYWEFSWAKLGLPDSRSNAPLAVAAGLGEIGWSGLLLTPEFGPRHKFVFLLTTAKLPEDAAYSGLKLCKKCGNCVSTCPVKALDKNHPQVSKISGKEYEVLPRHEDKCQWARSLGMVGEAGPECLGWHTPDIAVPDKISEKGAQEALETKDPLQVIGYRYPVQTDTIIEKCLQECPVGDW